MSISICFCVVFVFQSFKGRELSESHFVNTLADDGQILISFFCPSIKLLP